MGLTGLDPASMPRPVAHAYLRFTHETDAHGRVLRALKLFEVALSHSVWLAVAHWFDSVPEGRDECIGRKLQVLQRPTLGQLVETLMLLDRELSSRAEWWVQLDQKIPSLQPGGDRRPVRTVLNEFPSRKADSLEPRPAHRSTSERGCSV